jgi:hypothetical protein
MNLRRFGYFLALFPLLAFMNCSTSEQAGGYAANFPFSTSARYFQSAPALEVEVHYEPGVEPFTGNTLQGRPYWGVLQENLAAIFQYRAAPPALTVPKTLADMHAMPALNKTEWTAADLMALHAQYKLSEPSADTARFYVFFVKGNYNDGSGPQAGVIGLNVGGTPVLAIFKEVIQSNVSNPNGPAAKFVEQSTLVHEMGHALGFVDMGVPKQSNHVDTAHPGHTLNSDCVMYWLNEGVSDLQAFVQKYLLSQSVVMWGPEVLQDAHAISR